MLPIKKKKHRVSVNSQLIRDCVNNVDVVEDEGYAIMYGTHD